MAVDCSDDDAAADRGRPAKRLRAGPYPPPSTDTEIKLANKIFQAITGERRTSVPFHIATEYIECTAFDRDVFRVYLNLTRARDWGMRDGELSIDMLVFSLRTAAHTLNARHQVWSTLDTRAFSLASVSRRLLRWL